MSDFNDYEDELESFAKRKDRRKPKGRRSIKQLEVDKDKATSSASKFDDPGLQELYELGHISEIVRQLQSGKEATVYIAESHKGLVAAKVYAERKVRSFKVDAIYTQGRYITRQRRKQAAKQSAMTELSMEEILWIQQEFINLKELYNAGIPVPEPLAQVGAVLLMEFIGDTEDYRPAPRLSDVDLTPEEAQHAFEQSLTFLIEMLKLGMVHGDYSAFNLLYWQEKIYVIDVPQMVNIKENKQYRELLKRDVVSLCKSFEVFGLKPDPVIILADVKHRANNS